MIGTWERLLWLGAVVIALVGGGFARPGAQRSQDPAVNGSPGHPSINSRNGGGYDAADTAKIQGEKDVRKVAEHALSTPLRTERYHRVMQMLDRTTAENWQTLWKEYIRQTLQEGRVHEDEWSLFMNRVGELAGPEAMEYFSNNAQNEYTFNRREVLLGWASASPQAAYDWLQDHPEAQHTGEFWNCVLEGAASNNPEVAIQMLDKVPLQFSDQIVRNAVGSLIQSDGLANTVKALETTLAAMPQGSAIPPQFQIYYDELKDRSARMEWLAKSYPDFEVKPASLDALREIFEPDSQ